MMSGFVRRGTHFRNIICSYHSGQEKRKEEKRKEKKGKEYVAITMYINQVTNNTNFKRYPASEPKGQCVGPLSSMKGQQSYLS